MRHLKGFIPLLRQGISMGKPVAIWNCTTKKRYNTEEAAQRQADFLCSTEDVYVDVYHCNICENYHLTRQKTL